MPYVIEFTRFKEKVTYWRDGLEENKGECQDEVSKIMRVENFSQLTLLNEDHVCEMMMRYVNYDKTVVTDYQNMVPKSSVVGRLLLALLGR